MGFDRTALINACVVHGNVARVVVAAVRGSAPREVGAAMLIWAEGQSGTIGGGTLEHELTRTARAALSGGQDALSKHALGPDMGQCCGGAVDVLTEFYDHARATALPEDVIARGPSPMPLSVSRVLAKARNAAQPLQATLLDGWLIEPVAKPNRHLWIWGAGHVGRALVSTLSPLPDLAITWVDTGAQRFPDEIPTGVTQLTAEEPQRLVAYAPHDAQHLIVTYSHSLDLALCNALLSRGFSYAGLIGSATKWARFRKRLGELGHSPPDIDRITCPIGDPSLGKHPQAIALGVGTQLLQLDPNSSRKERRA